MESFRLFANMYVSPGVRGSKTYALILPAASPIIQPRPTRFKQFPDQSPTFGLAKTLDRLISNIVPVATNEYQTSLAPCAISVVPTPQSVMYTYGLPGVDPIDVPLVVTAAPKPFPSPVHEAGVGKLPKSVAFEQSSP